LRFASRIGDRDDRRITRIPVAMPISITTVAPATAGGPPFNTIVEALTSRPFATSTDVPFKSSLNRPGGNFLTSGFMNISWGRFLPAQRKNTVFFEQR